MISSPACSGPYPPYSPSLAAGEMICDLLRSLFVGWVASAAVVLAVKEKFSRGAHPPASQFRVRWVAGREADD